MQEMRSETEFHKIFENAISISRDLGVEIPLPSNIRKRKISTRIDDHSETQFHSKTLEEQQRTETFYPLIDALVIGIQRRFNQETCNLIEAVSDKINLKDKIRYIEIIVSKFEVNEDELYTELQLLRGIVLPFKTASSIERWLDWLNEDDRETTFSIFFKILRYFVTIPVTRYSCERAFSKLAYIKTKLRSTMGQERLDALLFLNIEQELANSIDKDEVIEEFKTMIDGKRQLLL